MKKVLVVATIYRCGEKIYPIIHELSKYCEVEILTINQMSPKTPWYGDSDLRMSFYKEYSNINIIDGPSSEEIKKGKTKKILKTKNIDKYDLIIIDDNISKAGRGHVEIRELSKEKTLIGCPHGNSEFISYAITKQIPSIFDYSFVFGAKEARALSSTHNLGKLLPGGIPANDKLKEYSRLNASYILIIVGYVEKCNTRKNNSKYLPFTEKTFLDSGVLNLQQKLGCNIIVKEKSRFKKDLEFSLKPLERYEGVRVIMDVKDDNELIANSICVLSSPSSLCFKSIQMGIPTVLLRGYGVIGNFVDWPGLVECNSSQIARAMDNQMKSGRNEEWLKETLEGGDNYSSTHIYCDNILKILGI